jgi:hypothetical protein
LAGLEKMHGASERQAAERVAALLGGSASFNAAVQAIREKLHDPRTLQEAIELIRRYVEEKCAAESNPVEALNRRRICW